MYKNLTKIMDFFLFLIIKLKIKRLEKIKTETFFNFLLTSFINMLFVF
jgi:hypothetical protein